MGPKAVRVMTVGAVLLVGGVCCSEALAAQDSDQQPRDPIARLEAAVADLPRYGPDDLGLSPQSLTPSRVIMRVTGEGIFDVFRPVTQVTTSLERSIATDFTPEGPEFRGEGFWIRWRANTHNGIDEAWTDLATLGNRRTISQYSNVLWFEEERVFNNRLVPDSTPSQVVTEVEPSAYYSNVTLPYVFAAMDVPAGTRFRLRGFSPNSNRVYPILVEVVGDTVFADASGQERRVLQVESTAPGTRITWFVRPEAPHYMGSIWRRLAPDGSVTSTSENRVVSWVTFDGDIFGNTLRSRSP